MSEIEQARIDVHHAAEQIAAVQYEVEQAEKLLHKWIGEREAIRKQFSEKCNKLAELRSKNER